MDPLEAGMADIASSSPRVTWRPLVVVAAVAGVMVAATLALWAHFGTAVFLEMVRAGFAACF
jgi:hypothetical protein